MELIHRNDKMDLVVISICDYYVDFVSHRVPCDDVNVIDC